MTQDELQAIKDRAEAATPGPWETKPGKPIDDDLYDFTVFGDGKAICWSQPEYDAEFIAHARTDVPDLLEEIARLQSGLGQAQDELAELRAMCILSGGEGLDAVGKVRLDGVGDDASEMPTG